MLRNRRPLARRAYVCMYRFLAVACIMNNGSGVIYNNKLLFKSAKRSSYGKAIFINFTIHNGLSN